MQALNPRPRRRNFSALTWVAAAVVACGVSLSAQGQTPAKPEKVSRQLEEIEADIKARSSASAEMKAKAEALSAEVSELRQNLITTAKAIQTLERAQETAEEELGYLQRQEDKARATLTKRSKQSANLLAALQRLSLLPPEAVMVQPGDPNDMVRSAILLRSVLPGIEHDAKELRADVLAFVETRRDVALKTKRLADQTAELDQDRARLRTLIERNKQLSATYAAKANDEAQKVAELNAQAKSLRELFERLEADRKKREAEEKRALEIAAKAAAEKNRLPSDKNATASSSPAKGQELLAVLSKPTSGIKITKAKGKLSPPVIGNILKFYGDKDLGSTHKGLTLETRRGAQVISPYDGQVVYAGEFRGYRQLLIIDHGEGYHSLLAGMDQIDCVVGQWLLAGEPVGTMSTREKGTPSLYVELRHDGDPINPLPWMAGLNNKARG